MKEQDGRLVEKDFELIDFKILIYRNCTNDPIVNTATHVYYFAVVNTSQQIYSRLRNTKIWFPAVL